MTADDPDWPFPYRTHDSEACEQCVLCGVTFGSGGNEDEWVASFEKNALYGPVVSLTSGVEFEAVIESEPGEPVAHRECYLGHENSPRVVNNRSLSEFGV